MKQALQLENEGHKEIVVGYLLGKIQAIDFTPIHRFVVTNPMQPGDMFEWDAAESKLVYKGNNISRA